MKITEHSIIDSERMGGEYTAKQHCFEKSSWSQVHAWTIRHTQRYYIFSTLLELLIMLEERE